MTRKDAVAHDVRKGQWKRRLLMAGSSLAVVAVCVAIRAIGGRPTANAQSGGGRNGAPAQSSKSGGTLPTVGNPAPNQDGNATSSQQSIVATVNSEEIHRQELAQECLSGFGKDVLETLLNKYLIVTYCDKKGIKVTKLEVDEEINRLAKKFSIPREQWLQMLKDERGIKSEQYANDIIWPMLALRKIAADRIQPTPQEIDEAFETQFGSAVRARIIVLENPDKATEVYAKAKTNPDDFGMLARKFSTDTNSASLNGLIQPIRRHTGDENIERAAFSLKEGEISQIIEVGDRAKPGEAKLLGAAQRGFTQYVILKCEGRTEAAGIKREEVRGKLEEFVREKKLRVEAGEVFKKLQADSQIVNVYNDPQKRAQMPGVAATINGKTVTLRELAEACIDRHGEEMLDAMINRKLLEQELKRRNLTVQQKDLDAELGRAAIASGRLKPDGKPNVEGYVKLLDEQGIPLDKYIHEAVWPSAALKVLVGDVKVSDQDIEQGYQANYGAKAEVRAIVLGNARLAQEVWQKARANPTVDFFGKLAEQYSTEPYSKSNQGRVPALHQYGGQPELQEEVFKRMKPGEISSIVQVGEQYIILYLEDFTKAQQIGKDEVRSLIYEDVHEKKCRVAMSREFDKIKDNARIDNYLANKSQSPQRISAASGARKMPGNDLPEANPRDVAIPAGYESTGLLPKSQPASPPGRAAAPTRQ
jgi:parvulin-like peptidyl-prolyl isomerase